MRCQIRRWRKRADVAQVSNLLYRRASSLPVAQTNFVQVPTRADWKSAIQQVGNPRYHAQSGSALVITLTVSVILLITVTGYLYWVRTQNLLVAQSQAWNRALAVAEAGIEDAMGQINVAVGTSSSTNYTSSASINFSQSGSVFGPHNVPLGGGSNLIGTFSVIIVATNTGLTNGPTLISTGYTQVPLIGQQV